ncbi:MAG: hypothetical protein IIB22_09515 [Chloroflexi bacterium]|nr:hypothetical protein [Chloroflexota bacterium]
MTQVTFRHARHDEVYERIGEVMFGDPPQKAVRVCESVERAQRFGCMQVSTPELGLGWDRTVFQAGTSW